MQSPYSNPYLSMRARGLFAYYAELGRVVSADELSAVMPEGRDSIQAAINELKQAGYVLTAREQINGKWTSYMKFTESAKKLISTDTGFSGHWDSGHLYNCTTTSTNDISIVDSTVVEVLRTSTTLGAELPIKEGVEMGWNLDGDESEKPRGSVKIRVMQEAEADPGAVGKLEDKKAMRQAKYGAAASVTHRSNKPEETWTTEDIVSEFASLLGASSAGNLTMQLNTRSLAMWINQQVGKGATRQQVLLAVRMFFEDPRNLNGAGTGLPVWRRFIAKYQVLEGRVVEEKETYEVDKTHQEKMLRLLGGKNV